MKPRAAGTVVLTALLLVLAAGGALLAGPAGAASTPSSTVATTTTLPVPKTTHAGVRRVLVLSLPAVSWEDLDLAAMPNLSALFAKSAVADLSVRGVRASRRSPTAT